jgi:carboxymethylenebutenolidase
MLKNNDMKTPVLLVFAALIVAALFGYTGKTDSRKFLDPACYTSCYAPDTRQQISLDAAKPGFAALHEVPNYFRLENPAGTMTSFRADGGDAQGYLIKSKKKTNKWLIVIQEWWGLNDYIKKEADAFYQELGDVNVLALDMYDGKVATTTDSAMKYMRGAAPARLENIVKGALALAGPDAKIYTVGWCFGGGWSLQTAIMAGKQGAGTIMYYGRPETNPDRLKMINADVIGFFGNKDTGIPPAAVDNFEKNMKEAGKNLTVNRYDAGHGFANPSNPSYDKAATEDAHAKAVAFLKARM